MVNYSFFVICIFVQFETLLLSIFYTEWQWHVELDEVRVPVIYGVWVKNINVPDIHFNFACKTQEMSLFYFILAIFKWEKGSSCTLSNTPPIMPCFDQLQRNNYK